jgi:hypothetical protein
MGKKKRPSKEKTAVFQEKVKKKLKKHKYGNSREASLSKKKRAIYKNGFFFSREYIPFLAKLLFRRAPRG